MLKIYNSLGREKQEFKPIREGFVGIYVCGPTVYGDSHIGHAKSYVSFDVIVRYLRHLGYRVRYVQNITDVGHLTDDADDGEDKVAKRAHEMGIEPMEVAERYTRSYFEDMDALNVLRPDISPRASGHIPEQIELIRALLDRGHAYEVGGEVYFDVTSFPDYGKLSGRRLAEMMEGVRIDPNEDKRHPADFALWKRAEPGHIMRWKSPWSEGFPGWHAECSAMGLKYLGPTLDIHGAGLENIFPHHEDEIAQSEGVTGEPFARYWMHNNMVTVDGRKMGKSIGNFIALKDAFAGDPPLTGPVRPMVIRYFILTSHYRSPLDFSREALGAAGKGLERIEGTARRVRKRLSTAQSTEGEVPEQITALVERTKADFVRSMDDDFNTAGALGHLSTFTHEVNRLLDGGETLSFAALDALDDVYWALAEKVLGILVESLEAPVVGPPNTINAGAVGRPAAGVLMARAGGLEPQLIEAMIDTRNRLREARQYEPADALRAHLADLGIVLKDGAEGTTWGYE